MTTPLLTGDVAALRQVVRPRWQRRAAGWAILAGAGLLTGIHSVATPEPTCTDLNPCAPDPVGSVVIGLMVAAAVAGGLHAVTAAWLAGGFVVVIVGYASAVHQDAPSWVYAVDLGFFGLCLLVAWWGRWRSTPAAREWLAAVTRATLPAGTRAPGRPGAALRLLAIATATLAVAVGGWGWLAQSRAQAQEQAATPVTGVVVAAPDGYTIQVRLPPDRLVDVGVLDAADHPVGQQLEFAVDDRGLHQPLSEPYDATGWLLLAVVLAGVAVALWARAQDRAAAQRDLITTEQPLAAVFVRPGIAVAAVYAADARPGEPAVAELAGPVDLDDWPDPDGTAHPTEPARLYGVPVRGAWCALEVGGRVIVASRPLRERSSAPPFTPAYEELEDERSLPHPDTLPLRDIQTRAIRDTDRDTNPHQVHRHRQSPWISYGLALGLPLLLFGPLAWLNAGYLGWLAIAGLGALVSFGVVRSTFVRGRLAWNGAGVAVVDTAGGQRRAPWRAVDLIACRHGVVSLHIGDAAHPVTAVGFGRFHGGERSAEQLAYALRLARERALAHGPDPDVDLPHLTPRPASTLLPVAYVAYVPVLAWALQAFAQAV